MPWSNIVLPLAGNLLILYLGISLGLIFKKSRIYNKTVEDRVVQFVIFIAFPLLILRAMLSIPEGEDLLLLSIILLALIVVGLNWFIQSRYHSFNTNVLSAQSEGAEIACSVFPNSLNLPFPIIIALIGDDGLIAASIFVVSIMILQNTLGVYIGIKYGSKENSSKLEIISSTFKLPLTWAIIAGILLRTFVGHHTFEAESIDLIQSFLIFVTLLVVGFNLELISPRKLFNSASIRRVSVLRFLIAPLVAIIYFWILSYSSNVMIPLFIQVMAPPAINNAIYAKHFGYDVKQTSQFIAVLTFVYLLFLPIQLGLIYLAWL
ncbi:MAG: AEC family transporter [Candidatus Kariarchaeaceae archaeon]